MTSDWRANHEMIGSKGQFVPFYCRHGNLLRCSLRSPLTSWNQMKMIHLAPGMPTEIDPRPSLYHMGFSMPTSSSVIPGFSPDQSYSMYLPPMDSPYSQVTPVDEFRAELCPQEESQLEQEGSPIITEEGEERQVLDELRSEVTEEEVAQSDRVIVKKVAVDFSLPVNLFKTFESTDSE